MSSIAFRRLPGRLTAMRPAPARRLGSEGLGDALYDWIKRDIVRCVLRPGVEVPESELVGRCETGKAPVRRPCSDCARTGW